MVVHQKRGLDAVCGSLCRYQVNVVRLAGFIGKRDPGAVWKPALAEPYIRWKEPSLPEALFELDEIEGVPRKLQVHTKLLVCGGPLNLRFELKKPGLEVLVGKFLQSGFVGEDFIPSLSIRSSTLEHLVDNPLVWIIERKRAVAPQEKPFEVV